MLQAEATEPVRTLVENIPGAATPETFGTVKVLLEQAAPVPETSLTGRLIAASASQSRLALVFAGVLAMLVALLGAAIAWRAANQIERPIDALIKSADRIGQGDYTRPLEVRRRDELGRPAAGARAHARSSCGRPRSTRTTCTACSTA